MFALRVHRVQGAELGVDLGFMGLGSRLGSGPRDGGRDRYGGRVQGTFF